MVSSLRHQRPPFMSLSQAQAQFLSQLLVLTGDTRLVWLPDGADTTTSTDKSLTGRTLTHNVSLASRLSRQGLGYKVTFNGTTHFVTTPDTANLSFNGTTDEAFSILALANVTDTAAERVLAAKTPSLAANEYYMSVDTNDKLRLTVTDPSATAACVRVSTPAITQGALKLLAASYNGAGALAANGMVLYQDGVALTSSATNDSGGTYANMENGTGAVEIGSRSGGATSNLGGQIALVVICQKNLTASEHWAIWQLVKSYFNL